MPLSAKGLVRPAPSIVFSKGSGRPAVPPSAKGLAPCTLLGGTESGLAARFIRSEARAGLGLPSFDKWPAIGSDLDQPSPSAKGLVPPLEGGHRRRVWYSACGAVQGGRGWFGRKP